MWILSSPDQSYNMDMLDSPKLPERFWKKVSPEPNSGCWLWIGACDKTGYGRIVAARPNRVSMAAHRMSYEALIGKFDKSLDIDHLCRVRCCVNPDHLEPVTRQENLRRGTKPRHPNCDKTHCPQGHPYEGDNLFVDRGKRHCMTCKRKYQREYARAKRKRINGNPKQVSTTQSPAPN